MPVVDESLWTMADVEEHRQPHAVGTRKKSKRPMKRTGH